MGIETEEHRTAPYERFDVLIIGARNILIKLLIVESCRQPILKMALLKFHLGISQGVLLLLIRLPLGFPYTCFGVLEYFNVFSSSFTISQLLLTTMRYNGVTF